MIKCIWLVILGFIIGFIRGFIIGSILDSVKIINQFRTCSIPYDSASIFIMLVLIFADAPGTLVLVCVDAPARSG